MTINPVDVANYTQLITTAVASKGIREDEPLDPAVMGRLIRQQKYRDYQAFLFDSVLQIVNDQPAPSYSTSIRGGHPIPKIDPITPFNFPRRIIPDIIRQLQTSLADNCRFAIPPDHINYAAQFLDHLRKTLSEILPLTEPLSSSNLNTYLYKQAVQSFEQEEARTLGPLYAYPEYLTDLVLELLAQAQADSVLSHSLYASSRRISSLPVTLKNFQERITPLACQHLFRGDPPKVKATKIHMQQESETLKEAEKLLKEGEELLEEIRSSKDRSDEVPKQMKKVESLRMIVRQRAQSAIETENFFAKQRLKSLDVDDLLRKDHAALPGTQFFEKSGIDDSLFRVYAHISDQILTLLLQDVEDEVLATLVKRSCHSTIPSHMKNARSDSFSSSAIKSSSPTSDCSEERIREICTETDLLAECQSFQELAVAILKLIERISGASKADSPAEAWGAQVRADFFLISEISALLFTLEKGEPIKISSIPEKILSLIARKIWENLGSPPDHFHSYREEIFAHINDPAKTPVYGHTAEDHIKNALISLLIEKRALWQLINFLTDLQDPDPKRPVFTCDMVLENEIKAKIQEAPEEALEHHRHFGEEVFLKRLDTKGKLSNGLSCFDTVVRTVYKMITPLLINTIDLES